MLIEFLFLLKIDESSGKLKSQPLLTTVYPTMWLGSQEGMLLVHSSISSVSTTIDKVKLKDSILCLR